MRVHLFPSRTQKLSSCTPTILGGRLPGKIGNANTKPRLNSRGFLLKFLLYCRKNDKKGLPNGLSRDIILCVSDAGAFQLTLGCRQAVRHQTLTLAFVGSNPAIPARFSMKYGSLAQLVEQRPFKAWVQGSSPWRATKKANTHPGIGFFAVSPKGLE